MENWLYLYWCWGESSAWGDKPHGQVSGEIVDNANHTGSSQSAPITTGILILLHEYLNKQKPTSWVDMIALVKNNARQIGDSEIFGRGMLDTKKLFPDILGSV